MEGIARGSAKKGKVNFWGGPLRERKPGEEGPINLAGIENSDWRGERALLQYGQANGLGESCRGQEITRKHWGGTPEKASLTVLSGVLKRGKYQTE